MVTPRVAGTDVCSSRSRGTVPTLRRKANGLGSRAPLVLRSELPPPSEKEARRYTNQALPGARPSRALCDAEWRLVCDSARSRVLVRATFMSACCHPPGARGSGAMWITPPAWTRVTKCATSPLRYECYPRIKVRTPRSSAPTRSHCSHPWCRGMAAFGEITKRPLMADSVEKLAHGD